ncbi:MAG: hydrogenase maturation protease [Candidatus Omnitrophica bacterium]|nr:hydrogenase maturation protease [Candidatus Omnitrophota bacterium]
MNNLLDRIRPYLKTPLLILGMGNTLRSDDGMGVILARKLKRNTNFTVWEVGSNLENYLGKIIKQKPSSIIIIDALDFGGRAGEIRMFRPQDLNTVNLGFTHNSPLFLAINYLQTRIKINIIILAVQPKRLDLNRRMTHQVRNSIKRIEDFFLKIAPDYAEVK